MHQLGVLKARILRLERSMIPATPFVDLEAAGAHLVDRQTPSAFATIFPGAMRVKRAKADKNKVASSAGRNHSVTSA